jgi:hypothetical protein
MPQKEEAPTKQSSERNPFSQKFLSKTIQTHGSIKKKKKKQLEKTTQGTENLRKFLHCHRGCSSSSSPLMSVRVTTTSILANLPRHLPTRLLAIA